MDRLEQKIINDALAIIQHVTTNGIEGPDPYWFWVSVSEDKPESNMTKLIALRDSINDAINTLRDTAYTDQNQWLNQDALQAEAEAEMYGYDDDEY